MGERKERGQIGEKWIVKKEMNAHRGQGHLEKVNMYVRTLTEVRAN